MSERGTNGPGHAEDFFMFAAKYECDFIAIQETRRDGRTTIQASAAGYVVHCSGHCDGDGGKPGILGVGLAVRESIACALGPDGIVPECYEPLERFIGIMEPRQDNGKQQRHLSP